MSRGVGPPAPIRPRSLYGLPRSAPVWSPTFPSTGRLPGTAALSGRGRSTSTCSGPSAPPLPGRRSPVHTRRETSSSSRWSGCSTNSTTSSTSSRSVPRSGTRSRHRRSRGSTAASRQRRCSTSSGGVPGAAFRMSPAISSGLPGRGAA